jgi:hypothetical protein
MVTVNQVIAANPIQPIDATELRTPAKTTRPMTASGPRVAGSAGRAGDGAMAGVVRSTGAGVGATTDAGANAGADGASGAGASIAKGIARGAGGVTMAAGAGRMGTGNVGRIAEAAGKSATPTRLAIATACRVAGRVLRTMARNAHAMAASRDARENHHANESVVMESKSEEKIGVMVIVLPCARAQ